MDWYNYMQEGREQRINALVDNQRTWSGAQPATWFPTFKRGKVGEIVSNPIYKHNCILKETHAAMDAGKVATEWLFGSS